MARSAPHARRLVPAAVCTFARALRPRVLNVSRATHSVANEECEVLIVGSAPVGLFLANTLRSHGVQTTLIDQCHALSTHPQAHYINARTMEIIKHTTTHVHKHVTERASANGAQLMDTRKRTNSQDASEHTHYSDAYWTRFAVKSAVFGSELATIHNNTHTQMQAQDLEFRVSSECESVHLSQSALTPILLAEYNAHAPTARFNTRLTALSHNGGGRVGEYVDAHVEGADGRKGAQFERAT